MPVPTARRAALRRRLLAWYDTAKRRLPWRFPQHGADPYRVWLAEVMLQQTQVGTVIPYYERFLARFPTLDALAAAREEDVLALWSGLGYYARGRNLLRAAREAVERHGGLPASLDALRALPGFGPYTAGAVASIAFAIPAAAVDGNVTRVLARLFAVRGAEGAAFRRRVTGIAGELVGASEAAGSRSESESRSESRSRSESESKSRSRSKSKSKSKSESKSKSGSRSRSRSGSRSGSGSGSRPGDLNQALMDLGATLCTPASPACPRCPVASLCAARAAGRAATFPPPRRRAARRSLVLACAILRDGGALLLARRPRRGLFGGLWAPPSVEVAPGADARAALSLALRDEHGLRCAVRDELAACERTLTHRALTLRAFRCELEAPPATAPGLRWVSGGEAALGVPTAMRALLAAVDGAGAPARRAPRARAG